MDVFERLLPTPEFAEARDRLPSQRQIDQFFWALLDFDRGRRPERYGVPYPIDEGGRWAVEFPIISVTVIFKPDADGRLVLLTCTSP